MTSTPLIRSASELSWTCDYSGKPPAMEQKALGAFQSWMTPLASIRVTLTFDPRLDCGQPAPERPNDRLCWPAPLIAATGGQLFRRRPSDVAVRRQAVRAANQRRGRSGTSIPSVPTLSLPSSR